MRQWRDAATHIGGILATEKKCQQKCFLLEANTQVDRFVTYNTF